MKKIILLGSTGSIGTQTLSVIENSRENFSVVGLACGYNLDRFNEQIKRFNPQFVSVANEDMAMELKKSFPHLEIYYGEKGLVEISRLEGDVFVNALVGIKGLKPTLEAIESGKDIALANKETLVTGGALVMEKAREKNVKILPVDSEHSAIFQCLQGNKYKNIKKIILTASGGPFRNYTKDQLSKVTLEQALKHPNWEMGQKITIDSATMMNKGLEVIEAKWLFNVPLNKIQVVVHPQSIVHSMVEYEDSAIMAQLGLPDMRVPISYALSYPDRINNTLESLDFFKEGKTMTFEKPDMDVFKCLKLAYEISEKGGSYPIVLNAANEELVDMFLKRKISFEQIPDSLEDILNSHKATYNLNLDDILNTDIKTRAKVRETFR